MPRLEGKKTSSKSRPTQKWSDWSIQCRTRSESSKRISKRLRSRLPHTKLRQPRLTPWWLFLLPQSQPLNRLRLSPLPLATSTRNILRNLPFTVRHADRWIDDLPAASSAERKDISSPTVRPVQSSSASFASRRAPELAACFEDKSWSYFSLRMTPKLTPTYS